MMPAMRSRIHAVVLPGEVGDFVEEVKQIYRELGRNIGESVVGECSPALDMFETDESVEIAVDLPGVDIASIRVITKGNNLLVAGEKAPRRGRGDSTFHLVERGYGRFARAVRLSVACDTARAYAKLVGGELRVTIPKIAERRGRAIPIGVHDENRPS
jgi:HSP20 family protein